MAIDTETSRKLRNVSVIVDDPNDLNQVILDDSALTLQKDPQGTFILSGFGGSGGGSGITELTGDVIAGPGSGSQAATGTPLFASGNPNAALLVAAGGLPNTTQSWPVHIKGMLIAGSSPSGTTRVQLASETAGTTVRVVVGSFLRYRTI